MLEMSNNRVSVKINDTKDEPSLMPQRSFITNQKTQLVLNVILIVTIVILVVLLFRKKDDIEHIRQLVTDPIIVTETEATTLPMIATKEQYYTSINDAPFNLVSRDDWFATDVIGNKTILDLSHPIGSIIIAHTATTECLTQAACKFRVRNIQKTHQDEQFCDIKYNFLLGGDGLVYEGRGWDKQGDHTKNQNAFSISVAFIGKFEYKLPNNFQITNAQKLIEFGVQIKKLDADYLVYPEKYFTNTESPGKELVRIIKKWPHYCNP